MKPNLLEYYRKLKGLTQEGLAELASTSKGQIYQLETGQRELTDKWRKRLAPLLDCEALDLIRDNGAEMQLTTIPVLGYVGAGGEIFAIDDYALGEGMEEVECPPGVDPNRIAAVKIKGDSMLPTLRAGWILYYCKDQDGVPAEALHQLCIVKTANDGMLVKNIQAASKQGHYHLLSDNPLYPPMFDVPLSWASKVIFIKPA